MKIFLTRRNLIVIVAILLFIFSISLRLWNLNAAGRVWDEQSLEEKGYMIAELIRHHDLSNTFWYKDAADHPVFGFYFIGLASYGDLIRYDPNAPTTFAPGGKGAPIFPYDLTYGRLVAVIVSSIAVVLIFFIGLRFFSLFVGIVSAIILATMPHFLAYSQEVELESWTLLFFTASAFSYFLYLEKNKTFYLFFTGILTGIILNIKQSNILILVLYLATYFVWKRLTHNKAINVKHFIYLGIITIITAFIVYPMPWLHMQEYLGLNYNIWLKNGGLVPELIFGRLMGARFFYYVLAFLITTPIAVLLLTFFGLKVSYNQRKNWIFSALIIWFSVPFLISFYHMRQNMVRYIIEFYAPLSLLAAIGYEFILTRINKKILFKYFMIVPLFLYLMVILIQISPLYLDYYNELVGGTKTVYDKKLFFIDWWGEGLKAPGIYLAEHAQKNTKIGLALNPSHTLYRVPQLKYELFNPKHRYDYVVVNAFDITRLGFNEHILDKDYTIMYKEIADGAVLASVYKHK